MPIQASRAALANQYVVPVRIRESVKSVRKKFGEPYRAQPSKSRHQSIRLRWRAKSVLRDPLELTLHLVHLVVVLAQSVSFTRVEHQLHRLTAILQCAEILLRLSRRNAFV